MYTLEIFTHPSHLINLAKDLATITEIGSSAGPLGYKKYLIETDSSLEFLKIKAEPYCLEIPTSVIKLYNEEYFTKMADFFLNLRIGAKPTSYHIIRIEDTNISLYYPMFASDYFYLRKEDKKLLKVEPLSLLGFYPISTDPAVWNYDEIIEPLVYEGGCVIREESLNRQQLEKIELTQRLLNKDKLEAITFTK